MSSLKHQSLITVTGCLKVKCIYTSNQTFDGLQTPSIYLKSFLLNDILLIVLKPK